LDSPNRRCFALSRRFVLPLSSALGTKTCLYFCVVVCTTVKFLQLFRRASSFNAVCYRLVLKRSVVHFSAVLVSYCEFALLTLSAVARLLLCV
jgi:hypothetical protein